MRLYSCVAAAMTLTLLTGCFDDKYDLSDIDDTIGIEVKDLVVPVNLEPVEFSALIDLDNEDGLEVTPDGLYAIRKGSSFNEVVKVNPLVAYPYIDGALHSVTLPATPGVAFNMTPIHFDFNYHGDGSDYIVSLETAKATFDMNIQISIKTQGGAPVQSSIEGLEFQLPAGIYGYYDTPTGQKEVNATNSTMSFPGKLTPENGVYNFHFHVTSFDATKAGVEYTTEAFNYNGRIGINSAKITTQSSSACVMQFALDLGKLEVTQFTGDLVYDFREFNRQYVNLTSLPEVLKDKNTRVSLLNPQIYVTLSNPLSRFHLRGTTGLLATQDRNDGSYCETAQLTENLIINPENEQQHYMVCPEPNKINPIAEFDVTTLARIPMPNLGKILYGNGLPQGLDIEFVHPRIDRGHVTDFPLGEPIGTMVGQYLFYAPLTFGEGSQVVYTGESHDWGFGDDKDFEISALSIAAHLRSDLPVSLTLTAEPIDKDGNVIKHNGKDMTVTITPATLPANADCDITIAMTGSIRHVDGIRYSAKVAADQDASTLRPDMGLNLTNIRAKVSGKYVSNSND